MSEISRALGEATGGGYVWGLADAVGAIGLALYIGSYFALQVGLIRGDGYAYAVLNLLAAAAVLVSLLEHFNAFAALSEVAWILISVVGIVRLYLIHRYLSLSEEEAAAAHRLVPGLGKDRVRRLLALGTWADAAPGDVLTTEGAPVGHLTFVADGVCRIDVGGEPVATVGPGGLVGELTYLTGGPATATVVVETPARLLRFERARLATFLARNEDVRAELEQGIAGDLRGKLTATSLALAARHRAGRHKPDRA